MTTNLRSRTTHVNGVDLHLYEEGEGPLVILAHGFPELAWSWRHQIPVLAAAGYHVVAPDQRGYGRSTRPERVEDYDIHALTGDLIALADEMGAEKAVFVGHDWGSMVVWSLAQLHPERVAGVVGMSVPFMPRGPMPPVQMMRSVLGDAFFYILYFQEQGVADAELGSDPATTMRRMLCGLTVGDTPPDPTFFANDGRGFVERMPEPAGLPEWLTQAELDHYIDEFARTGFTGGINWYRNFDRNWELTPQLAGAKVTVPSLFIGGSADPVLMMTPPSIGHDSLEDHRGDVLVEGAGHWVQQQSPEQVNGSLLAFLDSLDLPRS